MLSYVLRCTRVPLRVGKTIRHAMRHHWGLSHHAARAVYHLGVGSMLVCVAVPIVWGPIMRSLIPLGGDTLAPPADIGPVAAHPIPEPSSILTLAGGAGVSVLLRRRARKFDSGRRV